MIGLADVVRSTEAIQAGRYKAVNTAGAAVDLGRVERPRHAGLSLCLRRRRHVLRRRTRAGRDRARRALAASIAWVGTELSLTLRGGEITVAAASARPATMCGWRAFAASPDVDYAMFSGGGLVWAEAELKAGGLTAIEPDAIDAAGPDRPVLPVQSGGRRGTA